MKSKRKVSVRELKALEGLPLFKCIRNGIHLVFYCPYCYREHSHGAGNDVPYTPSHRTAHCLGDSPLRENGYYIFWEEELDSFLAWLGPWKAAQERR